MSADISSAMPIFESEYQTILDEVARHPRDETGGDLYGSLTHGGSPVIWVATGPGPRAQHSTVEFAQDPVFITERQRQLWDEYGLQYVGSWHSHHQLGLPHPSGGDVRSVQQYARRHSRTVSTEILATIESGRIVLRAFLYRDAANAVGAGYVEVPFRLLPRASPVRGDGRPAPRGVTADGARTERAPSAGDRYRSAPKPISARKSDDIPAWLTDALAEFAGSSDQFEVERRGEVFKVTLPVSTSRQVSVVVRQRGGQVDVLGASLTDRFRDGSDSITEDLQRSGVLEGASNPLAEVKTFARGWPGQRTRSEISTRVEALEPSVGAGAERPERDTGAVGVKDDDVATPDGHAPTGILARVRGILSPRKGPEE